MTRSKASRGKDATRPVLQLPERPAQRAPVVLPALESLPVSADQLSTACTALHAHASARVAKRAESDLLAGTTDEALELVITLKRAPSQRRGRVMPVRIDVPHPVIDPRERSVALLVKDPQREYKDLLEAKDIKFISRVVGVTKLKGKYKPFEARRQLMAEADMYLADERIVTLLPKLLGAKWLDSRKVPIPVTLTRADLKGELSRAIAAAYLHPSTGTCVSVVVGYLASHSPSDLLANLRAAIPAIAARIGWDEVQALHIKSTNSTSLPIYSCAVADRFDPAVFARAPIGDAPAPRRKIIALADPTADGVPDPDWNAEDDDEAPAAAVEPEVAPAPAAIEAAPRKKRKSDVAAAAGKPAKRPRTSTGKKVKA